MKNHIDTTEILKVYRENPKKGFELIYKNYSGPVFRYLRNSFNLSREEAEDILQNVFLPWVKEPEKLFAVENLSAYLFTSARNAALKLKNTGRTSEMTVEPTGNSHDERIETGLVIDRALNELPVDTWTVSCSCGADPDAPPKEEPEPAKEENPELLAKAKEYQKSGKFDKDKKEFYEYFDKILALDIFDKELVQKVKVLQEDYESRDNLLIKTSAPNFEKIFEKQFKMQIDIEELIK